MLACIDLIDELGISVVPAPISDENGVFLSDYNIFSTHF